MAEIRDSEVRDSTDPRIRSGRGAGDQGFVNHPRAVTEGPGRPATRRRGAMGIVNRLVHANPWTLTGIVASLSLFLGYGFARRTRPPKMGRMTTAMGRSYEDFDDALDE